MTRLYHFGSANRRSEEGRKAADQSHDRERRGASAQQGKHPDGQVHPGGDQVAAWIIALTALGLPSHLAAKRVKGTGLIFPQFRQR